MKVKQLMALNELTEYIPMLRDLEERLLYLEERINAINNGISAKRGPTPGVADLKKRVEKLEDAIRQQG